MLYSIVIIVDVIIIFINLQHVHLGQSARLLVLAQVEDQCLDTFSFDWRRIEGDKFPPVDPNKPNLVSFKSVSEEDLGLYRCVVKEAGKVVLTVYRALYKDKSSLGDEKITSKNFLSGMYSTTHWILSIEPCVCA